MRKTSILFFILISFHTSLFAGRTFVEGNLTLQQLMEAYPQIKKFYPQNSVQTEIGGKKLEINGQAYEWRYFSYSDPLHKLSKPLSFDDYVAQNKIQDLKSMISSPVEGLEFESFDFSRANIKDGIYFSMALRKIPNDKLE